MKTNGKQSRNNSLAIQQSSSSSSKDIHGNLGIPQELSPWSKRRMVTICWPQALDPRMVGTRRLTMLTAKHSSQHALIRTVHKLSMYPKVHPFYVYIPYTPVSQQDGSEPNLCLLYSWSTALSINKPFSTPNSDVSVCCTLLFFRHTWTWVWRQWVQPVNGKCCLTPILLSGKIPQTDEPGGLKSMGLQKSPTQLSLRAYPISQQRMLQQPRHYTYSCPNCEPWGNLR